MDKTLFEFPVQVYGELEKYNEVLSKARCKIFYKYANRNRTYITDEFADKLLSSLPYAPVKGIYDENASTHVVFEEVTDPIYTNAINIKQNLKVKLFLN